MCTTTVLASTKFSRVNRLPSTSGIYVQNIYFIDKMYSWHENMCPKLKKRQNRPKTNSSTGSSTGSQVLLHPWLFRVRKTAQIGIDIDRGKLLQQKLIHVRCTKKSTQPPVSPVNQAQKGCFRVSNGSVTPREEGFVKQTQVMPVRRWFIDDVASRLIEIDLEWSPGSGVTCTGGGGGGCLPPPPP